MEEFARSDLAAECGAEQGDGGVGVRRAQVGRCEILHVQIKSEAAAERLGKPIGRYVTVDCGNIGALDALELEEVKRALAVEIREMAERMCGRRVGAGFSVLVVGLGNADVTPDAVGPQTVRRLSVTRHLPRLEGALLSTVGLCEISALAPGVPGCTGLEAQELVKGAVQSVSPDLVIAVDALAARSVDRLAGTIQLCDSGIRPGSGVGNSRKALDEAGVGVPVMALGVPTVVESATLVCDALRTAGVEAADEALLSTLRQGRHFFVAPKEVDLLVSAAGVLLAQALEKAFSVGE